MTVNPKENYTHDLSSGEYILTSPVKAELHWSLPPSKWPINAQMRYTTDPDEKDKSQFKYYDGTPISFDQSGGCLKIVTSARDAYGALYYSDTGTYKFIPGEPSSGVTVSGTVTSYGSDSVTIQLIKDGTTEAAYEVQVSGGTQSGNKFTASYSFSDVPSGTYTMKVMKQNHVTREYTVIVGTNPVVQDVEIWLLGDVTGDGKVNAKDHSRLYAHINKTNLLKGYALLCADVTGDGKVNAKDHSRLYAHISKTNPLW